MVFYTFLHLFRIGLELFVAHILEFLYLSFELLLCQRELLHHGFLFRISLHLFNLFFQCLQGHGFHHDSDELTLLQGVHFLLQLFQRGLSSFELFLSSRKLYKGLGIHDFGCRQLLGLFELRLPGIDNTYTALIFGILVVGDKSCLRFSMADKRHREQWREGLLDYLALHIELCQGNGEDFLRQSFLFARHHNLNHDVGLSILGNLDFLT